MCCRKYVVLCVVLYLCECVCVYVCVVLQWPGLENSVTVDSEVPVAIACILYTE